jgi:hypothetical protein
LLNARAYRDSVHDVLLVETRGLITQYEERVRVSPMNTGATKPYPHPRGLDTFLPLPEYPFDDWRKKRRLADAVVEVAFEGGVPDIAPHVLRVVRMRREEELEELYRRT